MFLITIGAASAYDLQVTSVTLSPTNPIAGDVVDIDVVVTNVGPVDFTRTTETVSIDFGDSSSDSVALQDTTQSNSQTYSFQHTYTSLGGVTLTAQIQNLVNDTNSGNNLAQQSATVTNQAPVIGSFTVPSVVVGDAFSLQLTATDADDTTLTWSASGLPGGSINANTGLISGWTPTAAGPFSFTARVTDPFGNFDEETISGTVQASTAAFGTSTTAVTVGDDNQIRGVNAQATFVITNTGTQDLSNLAVEVQDTLGKLTGSTYNVQTSLSATSLTPGQTSTVTVTLDVPSDQDSEPETLGNLRITANGEADTPSPRDVSLRVEAASELDIDKVEIEFGDEDESVSNNENIDTIKEGDRATLKVRVENTYDDDIEIENVYVEIEASESDWDFIDDESDEEDIKDGDDYEFSFSFTIDDDIDEDNTDVFIRVYGEDEEGNFEHYDEFEFSLEIEREDDEITIVNFQLSDEEIQCGIDRYVELYLELENTGLDDQNEVAYEILSRELDWSARELDIELDEGDDFKETFRIAIPEDLRGTAFFEAEAFYDDDEKTDDETLALRVVCFDDDSSSSSSSGSSSSGSSSSGQDTIVVTTTPSANTNTAQPTIPTFDNAVFGQPVESSNDFFNSPAYIAILAVVTIGVAGGIVSMLFSIKK